LSRGGYGVVVTVKEVRGKCALGYKPGDSFTAVEYYLPAGQKVPVCLHALSALMTVLTLMLKGFSARDLGVGPDDDTGYAQCPDPGAPYTCGGTVVFELKRFRVS